MVDVDSGTTTPSDPFASGQAKIQFSHSTPITFKLIQNMDPNIWDLTVRNSELYAIVVSSNVDEVARVWPDGVVEGVFVTPMPVGPALADDGQLFVLDDEQNAYVVSELGDLIQSHTSPIKGGLRALTDMGRMIYGLGVGQNQLFGVHSLNLDTGEVAIAFELKDLADYMTSSEKTLIVGMLNPAIGCLTLRVYEPSGIMLQEECVAHAFGEVNGMAFDGQYLAISDRTKAMIHYFEVLGP